jgi:hypothetical protein
MSDTRRELVRLPAGGRRLSRVQAVRRSVRDGVLTPAYWLLAHGVGTPGLDIHRRCAALGARLLLRGRRHLSPAAAFHCVVAPLDSVRYFEFDFAWRALSAAAPRAYLDVSSPRLLPALLLAERSGLVADLLNPDESASAARSSAEGSARGMAGGELELSSLFPLSCSASFSEASTSAER